MRIFIGSTTEQVHIAEKITSLVQKHSPATIPVPWYADANWQAGLSFLENILLHAESVDAALLLATPDDFVTSREVQGATPRDNIILEAGVFNGALGRERTILLVPRASQVKLPTDYSGIVYKGYDGELDLPSTVRDVCDRLLELGSVRRGSRELIELGQRHNLYPTPLLASSWVRIKRVIEEISGEYDLREVDVLLAYSVPPDLKRLLIDQRSQPPTLRLCLLNVWDDELLRVMMRSYVGRQPEDVMETALTSIQRLFEGPAGYTWHVRPNARADSGFVLEPADVEQQGDPGSMPQVRLMPFRITYSMYRFDGHIFLVPLDTSPPKSPAPIAFGFTEEEAPELYSHYKNEFDAVWETSVPIEPREDSR